MQFKYEVNEDNVGVYTMEGNLIGENDGMVLTNSFNDNMEDGTLNFVMDLTDLQHINSSGLGVFITLLTKARKKGGELFLVNPSDYIRNLMMITKLNSIFSIFDTVEDAQNALKGK